MTNIYLVAYADDEGPYAVSFSNRAKAEAFVEGFLSSQRDDFNIIESEIDANDNKDSDQEERSYYDDGPCRFEDSPRYRADMLGAGRGRLLR